MDWRDPLQGNISNCYLISSLSSLAQWPHRIEHLFYKKKDPEGNCLWSVCLCKNGAFEEFVIDDFIPYSRNKIQLVSSRSGAYWPMLLEKAYAKIFGGYWNIGGGGGGVRALKDLTGAPVTFHFFDEMSLKEVFELIQDAQLNKFPMVAPTHRKNVKGLENWHSYSVFGAYNIKGHKVIKLRNPWGKKEWVGRWSDNDQFWEENIEIAQSLGFPEKDEGTFFIDLKEFTENFGEVSICRYRDNFVYSQKAVDLNKPTNRRIFNFIIDEEGEYSVSFCQPDKRYDSIETSQFVSMLLLKLRHQSEDEFDLQLIDGKYHDVRDLVITANLLRGSYIAFVSIPQLRDKQYIQQASFNIYGEGITPIAEVENQDLKEGISDAIRSSLLDYFTEVGEWHTYKSPYTNIFYKLADTCTGFGGGVFRNNSSRRVKFLVSVEGLNIARFNTKDESEGEIENEIDQEVYLAPGETEIVLVMVVGMPSRISLKNQVKFV